MSTVLVIYSTVDGQTRRIAERFGETLRRAGHAATLVAADAEHAGDAIALHDAVVVGAAIRFGHHSRALERLVRRHVSTIDARRNAFFSVCMCAGEHKGAKPLAASRYVEEFKARTGWRPEASTSFAGALRWTRYNPVIRALLKLIMKVNGGDTDSSRDREFTDWVSVERFARAFASRLERPAQAA